MRVVEVTWHAVEQFRERFPDESGTSSYNRLLIATEIENALDHHRYATKQPRWARIANRNHVGIRGRGERDRTLRFCWTEDQKRMYLVDKYNGAIRVVTSIRPKSDTLDT